MSEEGFGLSPAISATAHLIGAEGLHGLWLRLLRVLPLRFDPPKGLDVETRIGRLRSPIGLAAGYDKTGSYVASLAKLGFGYVVAGSFTLNPRRGHSKPRVSYRPKELAVVNAMGMPNPGVRSLASRLSRPSVDCRVVASIAGGSVEEIVECYRVVKGLVDGVEINISSPTFEASRQVTRLEFVSSLAERISEIREKPTYLKVPPPSNAEAKQALVSYARSWSDAGLDGITAINTLMVEAPELGLGRGGLSGRPLRDLMLEAVSLLRGSLGDGFEINAVGGIMTGRDALEAIRRGATTVQIFTALLYRGPRAAVKIAEELKEAMKL